MKRRTLILALAMLLPGCSPALPAATVPPVTASAAPAATDTYLPPMPSDTAVAPGRKLPAPSFEAETYLNETVGFALDYPAGWTVNEQVIGSRGAQVQFLSSPDLADMATLPEGATRVSAVIYEWDPRNDLAAYVASRKTAWDASGITVLQEEQLTLELGLPAVQFTVQAPEAQAVFLMTALGERYLVISGEGNLDLVEEIARRVRPVSR